MQVAIIAGNDLERPQTNAGSTLWNLWRKLASQYQQQKLWGRLGFDAGSEARGACRLGNRSRKSTVATFYSCQWRKLRGLRSRCV